MVLFGLAVQMAGKIWSIDRMALLYDDVAPAGAANATPPPTRSGTPRLRGNRPTESVHCAEPGPQPRQCEDQ
jgi:hypothetical protein